MSGIAPERRRDVALLVTSVTLVSLCAIVYELLISSLSSYLLGSSVLHFSLTIGLFMFFMGVGSFASKFVTTKLLERFIIIECVIGVIGGLSGFILYLSFSLTEYYYLVALGLIAATSGLVGLEIPLVTRIVREYTGLKDALANILAVDYLGALFASLLFPLVFLPYLGLMKTSFLVGVLNVGVAVLVATHFRSRLEHYNRYIASFAAAAAVLLAGFVYSFSIVSFFEKFIYQDPIVYSEQTLYQRIVVTKHNDDLRLFLNGNIQFSSTDEHRYHETLVHIPMSLVKVPEQVLILGGGDGLPVREVLKYPEVKKIVVVDIDPNMVELAKSNPFLSEQNAHAFDDPRVKVISQDAFKFAEESTERFSVIIADLPDPNDLSLGKLYSVEFYQLLRKRLAADGVLVTQSSSPYFAPEPFWSIHHTLEEVFPSVIPYWTYVPSFGPWGFNLASNYRPDPTQIEIKVPTKYLEPAIVPTLFVFDRDMAEQEASPNRLENQALVTYYEQSWKDWN